jgi:glycosyltransferase involved in cell wall biosynthesis
MSRICLYYSSQPERDRWLPGDRFLRPPIRRLLRGKPRPGGLDKVFANLCLGLDRLHVPYLVNLPFQELKRDDRVGVLGRGRHALEGYDRPNPIVAGIGLMTHPSEWPTLCDDYPVAFYLQHSEWANEVYRPYFKEKCRIWPVGIDTDTWRPSVDEAKRIDFLIYDKIHWNRSELVGRLLDPIKAALAQRKLTHIELRYGAYDEVQYKAALAGCRAMIFLSEHESQGLAYQECLAADVPVLAWDQGWCLDPNRFAWGAPNIPATSIPHFDERCGLRFRDIQEFPEALTRFLDLQSSGAFSPRAYITENLTLEKCARHFLEILDEAGAGSGRGMRT